MKLPLPRNPLSIAGVLFTTIGALFFLIFFLLDVFGLHSNPYMGMVFFLILPGVFIFGLLLIPLGMWRERRRRLAGKSERAWPRIDLNLPRHRNIAFLIMALTLVNVVIVSLAAYSGVHYMDSNEFCGTVCHTVMEPEFSAFQDGPHSRVGCVQCHIGPGAPWFVQAKISGLRQVLAVAAHTYTRPIASPVHNLRPARETCEQCHWPEKFHGDKVKVIREFASDESNTETATTLQIHVGGGSDKLSIATGIHWHMNVANVVEYIATDSKRQVIPWVRITDRSGSVREFVAEGVTPEELAKGERRTMDCVDCHNRPGHLFDPSADKAVNRGIAMGMIPRTLPFVKREAAAALGESYPNTQAADEKIAQRLREFYRTNYNTMYMGKRQDVERAVVGTQQLYRKNVFPAMNVTWGTYVNNIGHMDSPGCFRCHDDNHKSKNGKTIGQDCSFCHEIQ
jgi:hypothetical protein